LFFQLALTVVVNDRIGLRGHPWDFFEYAVYAIPNTRPMLIHRSGVWRTGSYRRRADRGLAIGQPVTARTIGKPKPAVDAANQIKPWPLCFPAMIIPHDSLNYTLKLL
jgi:hypothetical protein